MPPRKRKKSSFWQRLSSLKILLPVAIILAATLSGLILLSFHTPPPQDTSVNYSESATLQNTQNADTMVTERETTPVIETEIPQSPDPDMNIAALPSIAIIMDDLGADTHKASRVATLEIPVTMSIIPNLRYAQETMHIARDQAREVMVHLPMEPLNYPRHNPGANALMVGMTDAQISHTTAELLNLLPYARGCNNHMGSAFTQHQHQMDIVLQEISRSGLFFIDSLTSASSVAAQQAAAAHVPTAVRDVFLDNVREVDSINIQLDKLVNIARKNGSAIGICHPYPETITALDQFSAQVHTRSIRVVPASMLVN